MPAANDLEEIVSFISSDKPEAATRVAQRIVDRLELRAVSPNIGRRGKVRGTWEMVLHPYPYIAIYRITTQEMRVLNIRHAARRR